MSTYRNNLPQLTEDLFITSGGLETSLIYHEHIDLPCFASFTVLKSESGRKCLKKFLRSFVDIAQKYHLGVLLITPTWRCNPDWIKKLNYPNEDLSYLNKLSVEILDEVRNEYSTSKYPIIIGASTGPRGDGYQPQNMMTPDEAQEYHSKQIRVLSETNVDFITAFTLNYIDEAIGIVRAAKEVNMPIAISFTVETDGNLATGQTLKEAIETVDKETNQTPVYYLINCAHPANFQHIFNKEEKWMERIRGIQGNASKKSHAELDQATELDDGDPQEFGQDIRQLLYKLKNLNILGGCCGTDIRHLEQVCQQIKNKKS